jgi:hypothetical protein
MRARVEVARHLASPHTRVRRVGHLKLDREAKLIAVEGDACPTR